MRQLHKLVKHTFEHFEALALERVKIAARELLGPPINPYHEVNQLQPSVAYLYPPPENIAKPTRSCNGLKLIIKWIG